MFIWAMVQQDTKCGFETFYQIQNSVGTRHKALIQYKLILLVQICSKHFEGLIRGLCAGLKSICSHTAS